MFFKVLLAIFTTHTLLPTALALGINCRGSSDCGLVGGSASSLVNYINGADPSTFYNNGQQIACSGKGTDPYDEDAATCAFLQNTKGLYASEIQSLAGYITGHGCTRCGSVPTGYPGDNNVADGQLTFNYVSSGCGHDGVC